MGISEDTLVRLNIKKGDIINEEELVSLIKAEEESKCFNYALNFLGYRMRSEKEIRDRLKSKSYDDETIEIVIEKLKSLSFINDKEFAIAYTKSKISSSGSKKLEYELYRKGIDKQTINEVLYEYFPEDTEYEQCMELAKKRLEYYKRKESDEYKIKSKLYQYLSSKGYNSSLVSDVISAILRKEC